MGKVLVTVSTYYDVFAWDFNRHNDTGYNRVTHVTSTERGAKVIKESMAR